MYHWPPYIVLDTFPTSSAATFQTPNWKHPSNKCNSTSIMEERYRDNYPLENVEMECYGLSPPNIIAEPYFFIE